MCIEVVSMTITSIHLSSVIKGIVIYSTLNIQTFVHMLGLSIRKFHVKRAQTINSVTFFYLHARNK